MTAILEDYRPGVLLRREPAAEGAPLVFDIPRSGRDFPNDFRSPAGYDAVKSSISMYLDELFEAAPRNGAGWLYACFPNAYIDANRDEDDIDPNLIAGGGDFRPTRRSEFGVGLIHAKCDVDGAPLQRTPLDRDDLERRLDGYYRPYHATLGEMLAARRDAAGVAFHVSCHSMASIARGISADAGAKRSDFDLGDGNGVTTGPEFVAAARECLAGFGYEVTVNRHFAGAASIHKHGDPASGMHSLQIETRRGLYMNEKTYRKGPEFAEVQSHLAQLTRHLADFARALAT